MHNPETANDRPPDFPGALQNLNMEKFGARGLLILVAYGFVRNLVAAATQSFWYDEICTWIVARQPSVAAIWNALAHAVDSQSPGYYLLERFSAALIRNEEVAFRLPSILGFCCITICIFIFTRRRAGGGFALLCAAIPFSTVLFNRYAAEARPYCLVVACVAIALIAYQRAPSPGWMCVMGLAFAASLALNYYAALAMVPFGVAELYVLLARRRMRWSVCIALALSLLPMAFFWPLLAAMKHNFGEHFWAGASLTRLVFIYSLFFMTSPAWGAGIAAAAVLGLAALIFFSRRGLERAPAWETAPANEYVLVLSMLALPFIGFAAAKLTHSGITDRYVLATVLGISLAAGCILPRLDRRTVTLAAGLLVVLLAVQESAFWLAHIGRLTGFDSPAASIERLTSAAAYPDLPVVVSDGFQYLPIAHYAAPPWNQRFVGLSNPPASLIFAGNDSIDRHLAILHEFHTLHIYDFSEFAAQHPSFLLYSANGTGVGPNDWWPARLTKDGYELKVLGIDHLQTMYLVTNHKDPR